MLKCRQWLHAVAVLNDLCKANKNFTCPAPSATQTTADPFVCIRCSRCRKTPCGPSRLNGTYIWAINKLIPNDYLKNNNNNINAAYLRNQADISLAARKWCMHCYKATTSAHQLHQSNTMICTVRLKRSLYTLINYAGAKDTLSTRNLFPLSGILNFHES